MWDGWLSTSSNIGRPPLLHDSYNRRTSMLWRTNSSNRKVMLNMSGGSNKRAVFTETYPSYAHTPVVKLVLCSAEETLAEPRIQSAMEHLSSYCNKSSACSHSRLTMGFSLSYKSLCSIPTAAMDGSSSQMCMRQGGCWQWYVSSGTWPSSHGSTAGCVVCGSK